MKMGKSEFGGGGEIWKNETFHWALHICQYSRMIDSLQWKQRNALNNKPNSLSRNNYMSVYQVKLAIKTYS